MTSERKFKLVDDQGKTIADLPVYKGTYGFDVVDEIGRASCRERV